MPKIIGERRGNAWRFTICVPKDCLAHYSGRLLRKTVPEPDRLKADEPAHRWAADKAAEFRRIRETGSALKRTLPETEARWLARETARQILEREADGRLRGGIGQSDDDDEALEDWLSELQEEASSTCRTGRASPQIAKLAVDALERHGCELPAESQAFMDFTMRLADDLIEAAKAIQRRLSGRYVETPSAEPKPAEEDSTPEPPARSARARQEPASSPPGRDRADSSSSSSSGAPMLSNVIAQFMAQQNPAQPMYRKYAQTTAAFLECVGDRAVDQLKQMDVESFFETLCRLPPHWAAEKRRRGLTLPQLAAMKWEQTIAPKTFGSTYQAALKPFLGFARRRYGDQGFPPQLTAGDGIKYLGDRGEGENKQRALRADEITRLFAGPEMRAFADDQDLAHCYWLPMIGLYTGARVNEVCQLNPQADIAEETGVWFFHFTDESEGDERIRKSIKNQVSRRRVPIHSRLLDLGVLDYVKRMREAGAALLFPQWVPRRGKASANAEKWFRQLIADTGLRDETPGQRVVGFHAFRSTFENRAMNLDVSNVEWLTGHAGPQSAIVRGYRGEAELQAKRAVMERIRFDVEHPRPVTY